MLESGLPPQRGQSLVSEEYLRKMGQEIVRLCNGIERHGLVDYECGVWEELIIDSRSPKLGLLSQLDLQILTSYFSPRAMPRPIRQWS